MVIRSMLKWPNVPSVFGWLALDRRGNWLIRTGDKRDIADPAAAFDRIGNAAVIEFIGRNYARDGEGRYYFQNGPQRVYVALDYTPYVYRLDESGTAFVAHTGAPAGRVKRAFFDEEGSLIFSAELGVGVVLDRDLAATLEQFSERDGQPFDAETLFRRVRAGETPDESARRQRGRRRIRPLRRRRLPPRLVRIADAPAAVPHLTRRGICGEVIGDDDVELALKDPLVSVGTDFEARAASTPSLNVFAEGIRAVLQRGEYPERKDENGS